MNDKSAEAALSEAIAALSECDEYFDNRADADCDQDGFIPNKEMRLLSVVRTALRALENGPAGLADATNDPASSDLSSLRKEAEVAVTDAARDLLFHLELYDFSERDPSGELNEKMAGLKAALVSGSREEQS